VRLWFYVHNNDYYYPCANKNTFKFSEEPFKHFHLCILNIGYINYKFDLLIDENEISKNILVIDAKQKTKDIKKRIKRDKVEYDVYQL
jgi:hypothetical protein